MTDRENKTEFGTVRIQNEVLSSIASIAASQVNGVIRVGGGLRSGIKQMFSKRAVPIKGVNVTVEDNEIKVYITILVAYGSNIPQIASDVQESIKKNIEKMTGLLVSDVDVDIQGVSAPESGEKQ